MHLGSLWEEFRLLKVFYIWAFLIGFSAFSLPYMVLYFLEIELSMTQIGLMFSIAAFARLIFEVPSGAFADAFGRKASVVLGFFFAAILTFFIPLTNSFVLLLGFWIIIAVAGTFESGADKAWLVDYLKERKKTGILTTALGRYASFLYLGALISFSLSGLVVAKYSMRELWYIEAGVLFILSLFLAVFGRENHYAKDSSPIIPKKLFGNSIKAIKKSYRYSRKHPVLFYLMAATFFISLGGLASLIWTPFIVEVGFSEAAIGPLFAAMSLMGIIIPNFSQKYLSKFKNEKNALILIEIATFVPLLLMALAYSPYLVFGLWMVITGFGVLQGPVFDTLFQKHTPTNIRATTSSINEMVSSVGNIITPLLAGIIADAFGIRVVLIATALVSIPVIASYSRIKEKAIFRKNAHITKE